MKFSQSACLLALVATASSGCGFGSQKAPPEPQPRPVTVFQLMESRPPSPMQRTGSVTSWKVENIGFEVGGRIEYIVEPGTNVEGPQVEENSDSFVHDSGTLLARIDDARYQAQLNSATAAVKTAQAQVEAIRQELESVIPRKIDAAQANETLAQQRYDQQKKLLDQLATSQADYDKAVADLNVAQADVAQLNATQAVKEAELSSAQAQVEEAKEAVKQAERDLQDTQLHAPFTGQVSEVTENLGSVVQAGQAALTLQMMDPIEVDVQVSADEDARLLYNDVVSVFAGDQQTAVPAMVYEKAALADPATRTFMVRLLMRNEKILEGLPSEFDADRDVRTRNVWAPFRRYSSSGTVRHYVNEDSIHTAADGSHFLLRIKGAERNSGQREVASLGTEFKVERVPFVPGEDRLAFLNVAVMREIGVAGDIDLDRDLFVGELRDMQGTPLSKEDSSQRAESLETVYFVRERWRFRPGDSVVIDLSDAPPPSGYYVPMDAIIQESPDDRDGFVVTVDGTGSVLKARRIPVRVFHSEMVDGLKRIEAKQEKPLEDGMRLVLEGVHYLTAGESVRVTGNVELPQGGQQ